MPKSTQTETAGMRISSFRKEKGLTQLELAATLGVTQPVVSDYENDVTRLPADVVAELAGILGVTSDEILGLKAQAKTSGPIKNRRLLRQLQSIDRLPKRDQEALYRTIDAFLTKA